MKLSRKCSPAYHKKAALYVRAGDGMMNFQQKRLPSIGHGYASMPHSFKHGYGNPFRQQRLAAMQQQRLYMFPYHWH
ncbi:hypothetical protein C7B63_02030 [Bacillus halotolerans]|nr:hypothetical protein C7B63_02030 [Bacillus halotolerans]PRP60250.1 hypothetical protein C7B66_04750 [Bacillus halotolerans]PRP64916.1 hypothetical protein C7B72_04745 [Bacillus halotolerans]